MARSRAATRSSRSLCRDAGVRYARDRVRRKAYALGVRGLFVEFGTGFLELVAEFRDEFVLLVGR